MKHKLGISQVLNDSEISIVISDKGFDRIEVRVANDLCPQAKEAEREKILDLLDQIRLTTYNFRNKVHDIMGLERKRKHIVVFTDEELK
ncbi:hypothetical protein CMK19_00430 [Candidatus Poribacteria bacterium]|nr:hypothetical protein [Candidatus Poribacteria bacterium]|tara:strand:+ start:2613 stop:2879 length:267 start_codon:yes stop_codon:yes gene_type:complete